QIDLRLGCAGYLPLSFFFSLDHSSSDRARNLVTRTMGLLDCRFRIFTYLADRTAQPRLEIDFLAADTGDCHAITLRDLFHGREIVAQTLCLQHLLHLNDGSLARWGGRPH